MYSVSSSLPVVSERGAAFSRLAARVLETLNAAVEKRRSEGDTLAQVADQMGCHRSMLSRTLNGTSRNLTLRTIADILWATRFEPADFSADPIEEISPNWTHYSSSRASNDLILGDVTRVVKIDTAKTYGLKSKIVATALSTRILEPAL